MRAIPERLGDVSCILLGAIQIDITFTFNSTMKNSVKCQLSCVLSDLHEACLMQQLQLRLDYGSTAVRFRASSIGVARIHESRAIVDSQSRCRLAVVITA